MDDNGIAGVWALHGIRLRTADLDLRVMTEADLPVLARVMPADLELNPHATRYAGLDEPANRRAVLAQGYWRALGMWSPDDWALPFVARSGGEVVGAQWLEGPDWTSERTVDSVVSRLRRKIERNPNDPEMILTAWGVGYKFADV